jgi:hypothetical protein
MARYGSAITVGVHRNGAAACVFSSVVRANPLVERQRTCVGASLSRHRHRRCACPALRFAASSTDVTDRDRDHREVEEGLWEKLRGLGPEWEGEERHGA